MELYIFKIFETRFLELSIFNFIFNFLENILILILKPAQERFNKEKQTNIFLKKKLIHDQIGKMLIKKSMTSLVNIPL